MIARIAVLLILLAIHKPVFAQGESNPLTVKKLNNGVILTFDEPLRIDPSKFTDVVIYALPNGNSTLQTFGKQWNEGDDWHFDIQHIGAQTGFIRNADHSKNYVVIYAENIQKSWPLWRKNTPNSGNLIVDIISFIELKYKHLKYNITLSSHSGGGSFIFGYLNATPAIPNVINRISFLDATYGYETDAHMGKLKNWLKKSKHHLEVIAYNDSVVVYNGKPLVSPTGGTWYRSKLMAKDLHLQETDRADRLLFNRGNTEMILVKNPEAKIYHTVLVEKNGFIHAIFSKTRFENKGYQFWGLRAYSTFISGQRSLVYAEPADQ